MALHFDSSFVQAQSANASDPGDLGFLGFWRWNVKSGIVSANSAINSLFGLHFLKDNADAPVGEYTKRVHPDDVEWLKQGLARCFGPSGHGVLEYRVVDEAGHIHWVMCRALYEFGDDGQLVRAQGLLIDVTRFKADGNAAQVAPAILPNPLQSLVDATLDAHRAAVQFGEPELLRAVETVLMRAGKLLARQLTQSEVTRAA